MERNKLLNLPDNLKKPILEQKKQLIEKYEEYSKQQNRAREELRRNQRDYEAAKERYNRDVAAGKENAYLDENHYKDQIQSSQEQFNESEKKRETLQQFFDVLKQKGFKGAYELVKSSPDLTRDAPILLNWVDAVDPVIKNQFNSKVKLLTGTAGISTAAAALFAWLHTNPPSLYAKEIGEAKAAVENLPEEKSYRVKESLNRLASETTESEKDILSDPEKAQSFIGTLAETKQDIDATIHMLRKNPNENDKLAIKELADVSDIIGSRLKSLGNIVGVDVGNNEEIGSASATKSSHTNNAENIKQIQKYLGRRVDPRVVETGEVDRETEQALTNLENKITQSTGKDVTGLLLRNGKVIDYNDFIHLMSVVFK